MKPNGDAEHVARYTLVVHTTLGDPQVPRPLSQGTETSRDLLYSDTSVPCPTSQPRTEKQPSFPDIPLGPDKVTLAIIALFYVLHVI